MLRCKRHVIPLRNHARYPNSTWTKQAPYWFK